MGPSSKYCRVLLFVITMLITLCINLAIQRIVNIKMNFKLSTVHNSDREGNQEVLQVEDNKLEAAKVTNSSIQIQYTQFPTPIHRKKIQTRPPLPEKPIRFNFSSTPTISFSPTPFPTNSVMKSIVSFLKSKPTDPDIVVEMRKKNILDTSTLLTIGTTIIHTTDPKKQLIQENCLKTLNSFYPFVRTIVFDKTLKSIDIPNSHLQFESSFDVNPFGTPFFKSMMIHLEEHYESPFYGYCNGDLLFHSSLIPTLYTLVQRVQSGELKPRTFFVGRRVNYDHQDITPIPTGIIQQDHYINERAHQGYLFQTDAEDYFIFTKNTLPWNQLKDVVIGRPGYDNYLVNYVYNQRASISLIDTTNSILIVHQTDKDGTKAGFRQNPDLKWNLDRIGNEWWMGRTEFTPLALEITPKGDFRMQHRDIAGVRCDDDYLQQELDVLAQYIQPTDICLQTIHRATTGVLLNYCKEVYVVIWDGRVYEPLRKKYEHEPRMHIIYGVGFLPQHKRIPSIGTFRQYVNGAVMKDKSITVFINDGYVKPQNMREVLPKDAYMIVFDTAKEENQYYQIIRQYYGLVKDYKTPLIPGQEYTGITVYQNSNSSSTISFPGWW